MALRLRILAAISGLAAVLVVAFLIVPAAAAQGLVPICGAGPYDQAIYCQFCHLFELFNNVIRFLVVIGSSVAAAMFAWAGLLIFTAGGSPQKIEKAKTIFFDVFWGYLLALAAVITVQVVVNSVAQGKLSWQSVQCEQGRILEGGIRFPGGPTTVCTSTSPEGCVETVNPEYSPVISYGGCSESEMEKRFPGNGAVMACVCGRESAGGNVGSGIDVMWNMKMSSLPPEIAGAVPKWQQAGALRFNSSGYLPFSWGVFQINLAAHDISCNGQTLNCTQAFKNQDTELRDWDTFVRGVSADVRRKSPQASGALGYGKVVDPKKAALFVQCVDMALDRSCNLEYASKIASGGRIAGPWSTSYTACQQKVRSGS